MIEFGRHICGDLASAERREWLVTNGIGGFASGTIAGSLTRRYHGFLIAALRPPVERTLLVTKLDETAMYVGESYDLGCNRWSDGSIEPKGQLRIERFHLEGTTPVWTYAFGDALLERRIFMPRGENTTIVIYTLARGLAPVLLDCRALVNYRGYHNLGENRLAPFFVDPIDAGFRVVAHDQATPFYLASSHGDRTEQRDWYRNYFLDREAERGLEALEDHLCVARFRDVLERGQSLTIALSTTPDTSLDGPALYREHHEREQELAGPNGSSASPPWIQQLRLAARQFVVKRPRANAPQGSTVIAGYPWFTDWGRDTMLSLPGLTLATGDLDTAREILQTYADFVDQGMLPNRFPDNGEAPQYNTVDATLWYFQAIDAYARQAHDYTLVDDLFGVLESIIDWHCKGTRYSIHRTEDGLLHAGEAGAQLTWMDAKVGDWVVTPRTGKPVEVNALWYNALVTMARFAAHTGRAPEPYEKLAQQARTGFQRFWNGKLGYCYDVLDGKDGPDATLRPNQLLAVSLAHSPLHKAQQRSIVEHCARKLLTSHGMRTLSSDHAEYQGQYSGPPHVRDAAYHQGTVWGWLIGPFVSAHYRVYRDAATARGMLESMARHMTDAGLGTISEIFDGDSPHSPRGCIAQAWSVAEVLRAWNEVFGGAIAAHDEGGAKVER
ncbi:MAG: glycogen debranching enzyme family protein [Myxococcales bacterium]|nr:glycogen debranching enzyme family protein [Myxococcales bacterium]